MFHFIVLCFQIVFVSSCQELFFARKNLLFYKPLDILNFLLSYSGSYIWHSCHPVKLKDSLNMTVFNWKCAHYSEFNDSDTLLLVSGIIMGPETSTCGEIVVFYVEDFLSSDNGILKMKCRIDNTPYSLFGTWFNESLLLSGNRFWLGGFVTAALIYMNRASQETSSEFIPVTQGLFKFYNTNRSSLTSLLIAKCLRNAELDSPDVEPMKCHFDKSSFRVPDSDKNRSVFRTIIYNNRYREYEDNVLLYGKYDRADEYQNDETSFSETSSESDQNTEAGDKYLIFITGTNTFIPHEIGIKRIRSFKFPERIDPGPSLKERQMLLDERKRLLETGVDEIYWNDIESLAEKFDRPDHVIDLHGHILGMRLSPDHRFLYVTIRRWPEWESYNFFDVMDPVPSVENDISLNVIDLVTLEIVGITTHDAEEAYSSDADYYFVYMDLTEELVVSTGEGPNLHIWDRHYGIPLASLTHKDIVNAVAFNPKDPEMMVSVSDDGIIKVWRSPSVVMALGIQAEVEEEDISGNESWRDVDSETSE
ncbi:hypothetical protein WA026_020310 [Henosepilachna vigintioctopunctata]|uniref:Uncharacterized protein n=1 Tax=Henosepilachna vigintioctopunctata TaxID=420089 RepID=A0AAW1TX83_9CUCU